MAVLGAWVLGKSGLGDPPDKTATIKLTGPLSRGFTPDGPQGRGLTSDGPRGRDLVLDGPR